MRIRNFAELSEGERREAARILMEALAHVPSAWHDWPSAIEEVDSFVTDSERFALGAFDGDELRGWIGAIRQSEHVWELHPLAVDPPHQRQGWGTRLVRALEDEARAAGVVTIWLGTDDDFGGTNLYGRDLYPDVLGTLAQLVETEGHPFRFYERLGFSVVGVMPDANGFGKHDILMAKRVDARALREIEPGDIEPGDVEPGDVEPDDVEPDDVEPIDAGGSKSLA